MALAALKILVVDDDENIREIVSDLLASSGFPVAQASGGRLAMEAIMSDQAIDLVISDIKMPDGDGIGLMKSLHALDRSTKPKLILVTGFSELSAEDAERHGVVTVLSKPFSLNDVLSAISQAFPDARRK